MAELQHVSGEDDEAVGPDGIFGWFPGSEGLAGSEGKAEVTLLHEGSVDFLAETHPEGSVTE